MVRVDGRERGAEWPWQWVYRVQSVEVVAPFTLQMRFDDGVERRIDFSSILAGELYGPLRDIALFNQVVLTLEVHTVVWPNGAD